MNFTTTKDLAKIVGKSPATVTKYAPLIPGAEKHGYTWFFTDIPAAVQWFEDRAPAGKPPKK